MKHIHRTCIGLAALAACISSSPALAQIDKLATYAQMRAIAADQQSIRGVPSEQNRDAQLQQEFDTLKASMGGDDPTTMYEARAGAAVNSAPVPHIAPTPPPGGVLTTTTVTNSTPTAVPTGPAVVTSTLIVAGAGSYIWDVDVTTFLTHTFAADMDVTIQSPAGTIVTLTTDNGAGNDNVFNGTVWDDQGNPGGQVPYTTNDGMVTDHLYANLTLASPLVPEEALGAFRGEDPNGTWTITVSDDLAGDGGSLDSWSLDVFTLPAAPIETTTTFSNTTPTAIATGPAVVTSTIVVSGAGTALTALDVTTAMAHTFSADLDVTLTSPAGTVVTFTTDNGAGNDNVFNGSNWDDNANAAGQVPYTNNDGMATDHLYVNLTTATPLVVEEALSAFLGQDPNGTWTLTVSDDLAGDGGSLDSWSLDVTTGASTSAPVFDYVPAPAGTVAFAGGTTIGSTGTGTITVSVLTPGSGTGASATTTTTCTAPGAPFAGFGQTVTAEGTGAISGGPLTGTCTLGVAAATQTLTCSENQGGTPVARTFELNCPAGTAVPLTSTPMSGSTINLPGFVVGGTATTANIDFQNPGIVDASMTCVAPTATEFTVSPLVFTVPAAGTATTTVSFNPATAGAFTGVLNCTAGTQAFTFNLAGFSGFPANAIPTLGDGGRYLMILAALIVGLMVLGTQTRRS
jgi:subtilisin-like proprotein convertase family protein